MRWWLTQVCVSCVVVQSTFLSLHSPGFLPFAVPSLSLSPWIPWQRAVIGHTEPSSLFVSPAVACGGTAQAAGPHKSPGLRWHIQPSAPVLLNDFTPTKNPHPGTRSKTLYLHLPPALSLMFTPFMFLCEFEKGQRCVTTVCVCCAPGDFLHVFYSTEYCLHLTVIYRHRFIYLLFL